MVAGSAARRLGYASAVALGITMPIDAIALPEPGASLLSVQYFMERADKLIARINDVGDADDLPRADDPDLTALQGEAIKLGSALGTKQAPLDLGSVMPLCEKANEVTKSYVYRGVKEGASGSPRVAENSAKYFDEVYPLLIFSLHCNAAAVLLIEEFALTLSPGEMTPARRQGLAMVRAGTVEQVKGILLIASDSTVAPIRSREALQTVSDRATSLGRAMTVSQKAEITRMLEALAGSSPEMKPMVHGVVAALKGAKCDKLCD